jgi:hypothetical protein
MKQKNSRIQPKEIASPQPNEGEGSKSAARQYNEAQRREFVRSGKVEKRADAAEKALDSAERRELEEAELVGKSHSAGEDVALKKR